MSWQDCRRRREAINAVLAFAERNPGAPVPFDSMPGVGAAFSSRSDLLLALQYDWQQELWAQVDLHSLEESGRPQDAAQVCRAAWDSATALRPVLRRLLDQHLSECNDARVRARQENRLVCAGIGHFSPARRYLSPAQVA